MNVPEIVLPYVPLLKTAAAAAVSYASSRAIAFVVNADTPARLADFSKKGKWQARVANGIAALEHAGNFSVGAAIAHGIAVFTASTVKLLAAVPNAPTVAPTPPVEPVGGAS